MGLKPIIIDLFHLFNLHFGIHCNWYHETSEKLPFYLPFGKVVDTPSPSLPRLRGKVLQLHPWRLRSGASSTFATLGISLARFFQIASKQEIRSAKLKACEGCGILYVPEPQLDKISHDYSFDYTRFCPRCRKVNIGEVLLQLSPWHRQKREEKSVKSI